MPKNQNRPATLDHLQKKKPLERKVPVVLNDEPTFALQAAEKELTRVQGEFDSWMAERRELQIRALATLPVERREAFLTELPDPPGTESRRAELLAAKEAVEGAKEALRADTVMVTVRAIGRKPYDKLLGEHPPTDEQLAEAAANGEELPAYNFDTFPPALVAASAVNPVMPLEYVQEIWDEWNSAEITELFTASLIVNTMRRRDLGNA